MTKDEDPKSDDSKDNKLVESEETHKNTFSSDTPYSMSSTLQEDSSSSESSDEGSTEGSDTA